MAGQTIAELLVEIGVETKDAVEAAKKVDALKEKVEKVGDEAKKTESKFSGFLGGLKKGLKDTGIDVDGFVKKATSIPGVLALAGAAFATAAVAAFKFVDSQSKIMDELDELAQKIGLPVEELQRLQYAAGQAGSSAESLTLGVKTLNGNLLDIKNGGGEAAAKALESIGLSLADLDGKTSTQQIGLIGDALNGVSDAATRSAIAANIFGMRSGPELVPLLAEGSAGLNELAASAAGVFTAEQAQQASDFQNELTKVGGEVQAVARTIALELLPPMLEAAKAVRAWIQENDEFIKQGLGEVIGAIVGVVKDFVSEATIWISIIKSITGALDGMGAAGDIVSTAFKILTFNIRLIMTPFTTLKGLINDLIKGLVALGIVSEETGRNATAAIGEAKGALKDKPTANKGGGTGKWKDSDPDGTFDSTGVFTPFDMEANPEADASTEFRNERSREARRARGRATPGGGGGGAPAEKAANPLDADKDRGFTTRDMLAAFASGDTSALDRVMAGQPSVSKPSSDLRPQVVVNISNYNIAKIENAFAIRSTDARGAAQEVMAGFAQAITGKDLARAARAIKSQVVK